MKNLLAIIIVGLQLGAMARAESLQQQVERLKEAKRTAKYNERMQSTILTGMRYKGFDVSASNLEIQYEPAPWQSWLHAKIYASNGNTVCEMNKPSLIDVSGAFAHEPGSKKEQESFFETKMDCYSVSSPEASLQKSYTRNRDGR